MKFTNIKWSSYNTYFSEEQVNNNPNMKLVMDYFDGNKKRFMEIHLETDFNDYIDTKEDVEIFQNIKIETIFKEISEAYGIYNGYEMIRDPSLKENL